MLDKHLVTIQKPMAEIENIIFWNDYRITVLGERLFRIEKSENRAFRDLATQAVWFRNMPMQVFEYVTGEDELIIKTAASVLHIFKKRSDCYIQIDGKKIELNNVGNLLGTYRTLDQCNGGRFIDSSGDCDIKLGIGVCSANGVAILDDSNSLSLDRNGEILPYTADGTDEYVFAFGNNYRSAVKALYMITGATPMIPRYALGNWWSRYHAYTDKEYLRLITSFEEHQIPLTVATIDMDWHYSTTVDKTFNISAGNKNTKEYIGEGSLGWTGYTWNEELFPDYKGFLQKIKEKNLKITLNLHPADGFRWWEECYERMAFAMKKDPKDQKQILFDFTDDNFINAYFSLVHKPYENDGVDFWWIDWQQGSESKIKGYDPLWALNHYHYLDSLKNRDKGMILSRYCGPGAHRYPLGFSGDTHITWKTLQYLPYFTSTASNVGYSWWSHDIGGHMGGDTEYELFTRHIQYGVFSPINRLHSTNNDAVTKEPWMYGNGAAEITSDFLRFRHRIIPYLYNASYITHNEGRALVEPLYYEYKQKEAYLYDREYLFGESLLVIPVCDRREPDGYARIKAWLPKGKWTDIFSGQEYNISEDGCECTLFRRLEEMPVLARAGAILPLSADGGNSVSNPQKLEIWAFNGDGRYDLYEDDELCEHHTVFDMKHENGKQFLVVTSTGDKGVVPVNRRIRVKFKNIKEGKIKLTVNGMLSEVKELYMECATADIDFKENTTFVIEVEYAEPNCLQAIISQGQMLTTVSEGSTSDKSDFYRSLSQISSKEELKRLIDASNFNEGIKGRLKELLLM